MEKENFSAKDIFNNLLVYGTAHGMVDLVCSAIISTILFNQVFSPSDFVGLVILYNVIAFGL